jgi:hypothetical protein
VVDVETLIVIVVSVILLIIGFILELAAKRTLLRRQVE